MDVVFIMLAVVFVLAAVGLAHGCRRLEGRGPRS